MSQNSKKGAPRKESQTQRTVTEMPSPSTAPPSQTIQSTKTDGNKMLGTGCTRESNTIETLGHTPQHISPPPQRLSRGRENLFSTEASVTRNQRKLHCCNADSVAYGLLIHAHTCPAAFNALICCNVTRTKKTSHHSGGGIEVPNEVIWTTRNPCAMGPYQTIHRLNLLLNFH